LGAVAPGYYADIVVLNDLSRLSIDTVFYRGHPVAKEGEPLFSPPKADATELTETVNIKPLTAESLRLPVSGDTAPVIEVVPGQIITRNRMERVKSADGFITPDTTRDILKLAVVERHNATGNIGVGLVMGFGLHKGALASSIAHDAHNIIAVGASDDDILVAILEIERLNGGLVVVGDGGVLGSLPLPIAGLLSDKPLGEVVYKLERLQKLSQMLGNTLSAPFAALSFLALPVIPELRLTDLGLVDVNQFRLIR